MRDQIGFPMVEEETIDFVKQRGHGVLCLAKDNFGYGVPISFGFDDEEARFIMELVNDSESLKQEFLQSTDQASLTIYTHESSDQWESVIATGQIEPLADDDVSERLAALFFSQAEDVAKDLRWSDFEGFDRQWYQLRVNNMSGRHGGDLPHKE